MILILIIIFNYLSAYNLLHLNYFYSSVEHHQNEVDYLQDKPHIVHVCFIQVQA